MQTINVNPNRLTRLLRKSYWYLFVFLPSRRDVTIETVNGSLTFDSKDRTIGRGLYVRRHFEFPMMMDYVKKLREFGFLGDHPSGAMLDIGANIGMSSVTFLKYGIFEQSVAFEPFPNSFRLLNINAARNGLVDRIIAYNVALSNRAGRAELEMNKKNFGDFRIRSENPLVVSSPYYREDDWETTKIDTQTLDGMIAEGIGVDPKELQLVWMDIQGHEGWFFEGAKHFFTQHKSLPVVMEFSPYMIRRSGMAKDHFCEIIQELFAYMWIYTKNNYPPQSIEKIGDVFDQGDAHMLVMNP